MCPLPSILLQFQLKSPQVHYPERQISPPFEKNKRKIQLIHSSVNVLRVMCILIALFARHIFFLLCIINNLNMARQIPVNYDDNPNIAELFNCFYCIYLQTLLKNVFLFEM